MAKKWPKCRTLRNNIPVVPRPSSTINRQTDRTRLLHNESVKKFISNQIIIIDSRSKFVGWNCETAVRECKLLLRDRVSGRTPRVGRCNGAFKLTSRVVDVEVSFRQKRVREFSKIWNSFKKFSEIVKNISANRRKRQKRFGKCRRFFKNFKNVCENYRKFEIRLKKFPKSSKSFLNIVGNVKNVSENVGKFSKFSKTCARIIENLKFV